MAVMRTQTATGILLILGLGLDTLGQETVYSVLKENETVPNLEKMRHVASSNHIEWPEIKTSDLEEGRDSKYTNLFFEYKKHPDVGDNEDHNYTPPGTLMQFTLTTQYLYRFRISDPADFDASRIEFHRSDKTEIENIRAERFTLKNGKIRSRKIGKRSIEWSGSPIAHLDIDKKDLESDSYLEIFIETKTNNLPDLRQLGPFYPGCTNDREVNEYLSINVPQFFVYDIPDDTTGMRLISKSQHPFELLHFKRDRKGTIQPLEIASMTYQWQIDCSELKGDHLSFEMESINRPFGFDIGIKTDLIMKER